MLFIGAEWYHVLQMAVTATIGMVGAGAAVEGYHTRHAHPLQRILFLVGGPMLIEQNLITDIIGLVMIGVFFAWQALENKRFGGRLEPSANYYGDARLGRKMSYMLMESFVMIEKLFGPNSVAL